MIKSQVYCFFGSQCRCNAHEVNILTWSVQSQLNVAAIFAVATLRLSTVRHVC